MSNRAWVTLATNDSYGLGALVLAHSLRRAGSTYPAVVLITPSVTPAMRDRLSAVFSEVVTVDVLDSQDAAHLALLQRPELGITFTKIHCWNLTQYEKCVFLDADTLVMQNCDELFEREELSAAPDVGWPDCFNSGVFVFKPSSETFEKLIRFAQERGSFDGGDQGLLNSFFSDWARGDINKHLPFLYNVTSAAFYSYLPALQQYGRDLKIIHFIGAAKPWLQPYNWQSRSVDAPGHLREFLQFWWDLFSSQVHSQLDESMSGVAGNLARVVPGATNEALDELTRRQGWEAGNIDYMGVDSFENIWAKISQTLSQARPSPPKESSIKESSPLKELSPNEQIQSKISPPKEPTPKELTPQKDLSPTKTTGVEESSPKETTLEKVSCELSAQPLPPKEPVVDIIKPVDAVEKPKEEPMLEQMVATETKLLESKLETATAVKDVVETESPLIIATPEIETSTNLPSESDVIPLKDVPTISEVLATPEISELKTEVSPQLPVVESPCITTEIKPVSSETVIDPELQTDAPDREVIQALSTETVVPVDLIEQIEVPKSDSSEPVLKTENSPSDSLSPQEASQTLAEFTTIPLISETVKESTGEKQELPHTTPLSETTATKEIVDEIVSAKSVVDTEMVPESVKESSISEKQETPLTSVPSETVIKDTVEETVSAKSVTDTACIPKAEEKIVSAKSVTDPESVPVAEEATEQLRIEDQQNAESVVPVTTPTTPKSTPEPTTPTAEVSSESPELNVIQKPEVETVTSAAPKVAMPTVEPPSPVTPTKSSSSLDQDVVTPVKSSDDSGVSDSPPLVITPSKDEKPVVPAAKSTEEAAQETRL